MINSGSGERHSELIKYMINVHNSINIWKQNQGTNNSQPDAGDKLGLEGILEKLNTLDTNKLRYEIYKEIDEIIRKVNKETLNENSQKLIQIRTYMLKYIFRAESNISKLQQYAIRIKNYIKHSQRTSSNPEELKSLGEELLGAVQTEKKQFKTHEQLEEQAQLQKYIKLDGLLLEIQQKIQEIIDKKTGTINNDNIFNILELCSNCALGGDNSVKMGIELDNLIHAYEYGTDKITAKINEIKKEINRICNIVDERVRDFFQEEKTAAAKEVARQKREKQEEAPASTDTIEAASPVLEVDDDEEEDDEEEDDEEDDEEADDEEADNEKEDEEDEEEVDDDEEGTASEGKKQEEAPAEVPAEAPEEGVEAALSSTAAATPAAPKEATLATDTTEVASTEVARQDAAPTGAKGRQAWANTRNSMIPSAGSEQEESATRREQDLINLVERVVAKEKEFNKEIEGKIKDVNYILEQFRSNMVEVGNQNTDIDDELKKLAFSGEKTYQQNIDNIKKNIQKLNPTDTENIDNLQKVIFTLRGAKYLSGLVKELDNKTINEYDEKEYNEKEEEAPAPAGAASAIDAAPVGAEAAEPPAPAPVGAEAEELARKKAETDRRIIVKDVNNILDQLKNNIEASAIKQDIDYVQKFNQFLPKTTLELQHRTLDENKGDSIDAIKELINTLKKNAKTAEEKRKSVVIKVNGTLEELQQIIKNKKINEEIKKEINFNIDKLKLLNELLPKIVLELQYGVFNLEDIESSINADDVGLVVKKLIDDIGKKFEMKEFQGYPTVQEQKEIDERLRDNIEEITAMTAKILQPLIKKPKLTPTLLGEPPSLLGKLPFRFLHEIISELTRSTGFAEDLYTTAELDGGGEMMKDKNMKLVYLAKIYRYVSIAREGNVVTLNPHDVINGTNPKETNLFLQDMGEAATDEGLDREACLQGGISQVLQYKV